MWKLGAINFTGFDISLYTENERDFVYDLHASDLQSLQDKLTLAKVLPKCLHISCLYICSIMAETVCLNI